MPKAGNQRHVCGRYYEFLPGSPPVLSPVPGVTVLVTHSELRFAVSEPVLGRERRQPLAWRGTPRDQGRQPATRVRSLLCIIATPGGHDAGDAEMARGIT